MAGTGIPKLPNASTSVLMFAMEAAFWANRALWHLTLSGVFERFPGITVVFTEQGTQWVPGALAHMDRLHGDMKRNGRIGELGFDPEVLLPYTPSDYFRRNVFIGSAFPSPADAQAMREIGIDRILWGNDYPHVEACSPFSKESIRRTFAGWSPEELKTVLSESSAKVYKFDLDALAPLAAQFGPTVEEAATPLDVLPESQSRAFQHD